MKRIITTLLSVFSLTIMTPLVTFAHVVVTPSQAVVGDRVAFSVGVPNERESDITSLKLAIPKGVSDVTPDVIAGWTITTEKSGDDVTTLTWTGTIPVGQRADFEFKAQTPAIAGGLDWKAYQTYADGTVVSWDQKPTADETDDDTATSGPYSVTKVVNDLDVSPTNKSDSNQTTLILVFSILAFAFSVVALLWRRK